MTRQKLVFAAALLAALASPAFAGPFKCEGVVSASIVCGDAIRDAVTDEFTRKYPATKFKIFVLSGHGKYPDGSYSGSAAVWLGSPDSQVPHTNRFAIFHFAAYRGTATQLIQQEKDALLGATQDLMRKLGVAAPSSVDQVAGRQCRTVQETEQTLQSDYVCDYNNLGPTNCRTENKSVPRTVEKQVCTN